MIVFYTIISALINFAVFIVSIAYMLAYLSHLVIILTSLILFKQKEIDVEKKVYR